MTTSKQPAHAADWPMSNLEIAKIEKDAPPPKF